MTLDEFFAEAKRLRLRMLGTPEETRAALDAKDGEIERLRHALRCADAALEQCMPCSEPECAAVQQDYLETARDAVLKALGANPTKE